MRKQLATYFKSNNPSTINTEANGYALGQEWYNTVTGEKFYHKTDGVWISVDTPVAGLIKIVDKAGYFFTDLATAGNYVRGFTLDTITDESFDNGVYYFTVPVGSDFSNGVGFLSDPWNAHDAYIEDPLGLISVFGDNVLMVSNGNSILGNCTFGSSAFQNSTGNNVFGNCAFGAFAFNSASSNNVFRNCTFATEAFINSYPSINRFENILLENLTDSFAYQSQGRFEIYGNIGTDETAEYPNFFTSSTAVIWADKSKETSNAGGLDGDLATAQTNGATLFFGYAPTVVEDSISDGVINKAPSQNAVFDALALKLDDPSGIPSQYIRGDGTLASFPDVAGGGGGQVYYLNGATSQGTIGGTAYVQLSTAANLGTGVDFTSGTVDDVAFANFITDVGKPTQETIPAGVWIFQCYLSASSATCEIYATVEVYDGSSFTVLSTSLNEVITNSSTIDLYTFTCAVPEYTPLTTSDRVAIRLYSTSLGGTDTITLHTQDSHLSSIQTTFTTGIAALDGLTSAAQYFQVGTTGSDFNIGTTGTDTHTFNLPTASASNRGALSSTDWTIFNNKQDALGFTSVTNARTISTTSPLSGGGDLTANRTLSIPAATGSTNGYLSSADWSTFNGKAPLASPVFTTQITSPIVNISAQTATTIASFDASKNVVSLSTATYPSLSELSYVKGVSSNIQTQLNSKATFSGTTNYLIKYGTSTTQATSRIQDTGTYIGISTINPPAKDLTFVGTKTIEIGLEDYSPILAGKDLNISAGRSVNFAYGAFSKLNFGNGGANGYGGLHISPTTNVAYIVQRYSSLQTSTYPYTSMVDTGIGTGSAFAVYMTPQNNLYMTDYGNIYKRTNNTGAFVSQASLGSAYAKGITSTSNGDLYYCIEGGDIYKQTNQTGTPTALGQTTRSWTGLAADASDNIYACVNGGDVYKRVGTGNFIAMGYTTRNYTCITITPIGDVYLGDASGNVWKQTLGAGAPALFAAVGLGIVGITCDSYSNLYITIGSAVTGADVYFNLNSTTGTADLQGGTLKLNAGTGKGIGDSNLDFYTGQKTTSGTDMQTATLRTRINNEGLMTLPSVTNALIDADTTGKAVATKEWVSSSLNPRVQSVTSSATVTPTSTNDLVTITAQAAGLTIANPTGTMVQGQALMIRIKDNGTAQSIAFGTNYRAIGITLPTTTVISKTMYLGLIWNATDTKFDVVGLNQEA